LSVDLCSSAASRHRVTRDVSFEESHGLSALVSAVDGFKAILESVKGDVESVNGIKIEVKDIKESTSTQLTEFKIWLEGIKAGQIEAMNRIEKIEKKVFKSGWSLIPQELNGLVVFKTFPSTGNLYAFVKKKETFQDARAMCERLGMNLVDIKNAAENEFIWQSLKDEGLSASWIGLSKRSNGEWMWQDGGALNYQNWSSGQPGPYKEACMHNGDGEWYDCNATRHFMCKK